MNLMYGSCMAIMEAQAQPPGQYYDFQVKNGQGYILEDDGRYSALSVVTACPVRQRTTGAKAPAASAPADV
jgi:hypothetical protein